MKRHNRKAPVLLIIENYPVTQLVKLTVITVITTKIQKKNS